MGTDSEKGLTDIDEGGDLKYGIGIQVDQLNSIMMKKSPKERTDRQTKSSIKEIIEDDKFIDIRGGQSLTSCFTPSNGIPRRQDPVCNHLQEGLLRHG